MHLHRRHILTGLGAALVTPALPARTAAAPFRRKVGAIDVTVLSDGTLEVPMSFVLPETPPAEAGALLTSHGYPATGAPIPTNITLVKSGAELVLLDTGAGANFQPTAGKLVENMEAAGFDPSAVTKVVFTHGHADHLWGAIDDFDDSERFPKAGYVISAPEWDFWTDPGTPASVPDWLKGMARGSARILKRLEGRIERRKDGDVLASGVSFAATPGHTPGHMAVLIESGSERLLAGGDVLAHSAISFARPEWRFGSDYDRDLAVATRRKLLDRLTSERLPLVGFHLPYPGHGIVERSGAAYRFVPV
jgi:glyoxylase-like metal-dependent hydrolase (beta-lactamase superfamily II)